jgi:hypothetical protein
MNADTFLFPSVSRWSYPSYSLNPTFIKLLDILKTILNSNISAWE